jgi:nicotinamidase-related amidase
MDPMKTGGSARPRCLAPVPNVKRLNDAARAAGAVVFHTLVGPPTVQPAAFVDQSFAPKDGEWVYQRGPDKFLGSPLEQRLKDRGRRP